MVGFQDLINYFIYPYKTGYDVPKTLIYAIVLILVAYLIYKLLKKLKIKIDRRLVVAVSPYVILGGILRVLQDSGILTSALVITPGIYFFVFLITLVILLFSLVIEKKKGVQYFKTMFILGLIFVSFSLPFVEMINFKGAITILTLFLPWIAIFYIIKWKLENKIVSLIHLFDGTTTFVALNFFGYAEQHVLPTFLFKFLPPVSFIFLKLIIVVTILVLIDRFCKDKEFKNYLKLIIGILGGSTGTRDFIRLLALA